VRAGAGRAGAGSGAGFGARSGTGSRIGSTTIFLTGLPISIRPILSSRLTEWQHLPPRRARGRARRWQAGALAAD